VLLGVGSKSHTFFFCCILLGNQCTSESMAWKDSYTPSLYLEISVACFLLASPMFLGLRY
jgi:hypothetical protein